MAVEGGDEYRTTDTPRLLGAVADKLALAGGVVMLAAAFLVCASVGLRWATSSAIPGDFELVQIAVAVSAFAFLPFCQLRRGNIFVGTFTTSLPRRAFRHRTLAGLNAGRPCPALPCWPALLTFLVSASTSSPSLSKM